MRRGSSGTHPNATLTGVSSNVNLGVGESHRVRLPGLGTAGYRWMSAVEGDACVAEVSDAVVTGLADRRNDASAAELFAIRAIGPGVARVRFAQRRPFEPDDVAPADEQVVGVRVP